MLSQGFAGRILPVNPNRATIQGLAAYVSVAALPEVPDVAIIAVAATAVPDVVLELAARGTRSAIVFSAGFSEAGEQGTLLQAQMVANARRHGMRLLGPNSLGVVCPRSGFFGSFVSSVELGMPMAGRVGIVSQSGAYGGHLLAAATAANIGLSAVVMTGNESDLSLGDVVQGLVDDDATEVIALYSEGIREAAGLIAALEAARRARKPVVMMKVGRSAVGSAAAQSHTASIAGNDAVIDAVLAELAVVRAQTTDQLLDIAKLATRRIYPVNNALGIITVSGGAGVIASDAAEDLGLPVPAMPEAAQARLKEILPFASPRNPVDTTAQFLNDMSLVGTFTEAMITRAVIRLCWDFSATRPVPRRLPPACESS
jgi:acyl-CoA synthetase (NDP forming)